MKYIDLYRPSVYVTNVSTPLRHCFIHYSVTGEILADILVCWTGLDDVKKKFINGIMDLCKIDGYKNISNDVKYLFKLRSLPDHTIVFENHLSIITILNSGFNSRFIVRLKENLIKLQEGL